MQVFDRQSLSLSGEWGFYVDPMHRGIRQEWWKNRREKSYCFPCYDVNSRTCTVPHNWCSEPDLRYYDGTCLYQKIFDYPYLVEGKRTYITFGAVNFECSVYLNGEKVGEHNGGYLEFSVDVTEYIRPTDNDLWLVVDNTRHEGRIPAMIFDWWNDGGIIRDVVVYSVCEGGIDSYRLTTTLEGDSVMLSVSVVAGDSVTLEIEGLGVCETFRDSTTITMPRDKVRLYSDVDPHRYIVKLSTIGDSISEMVGLREVKVEGREIYLNGEKLFLKGVNVHEDFAPLGSAENHEAIDRVIEYCKQLGVNFIRLAHYPHSRYFMDKAEEAGILMEEEIPLYWYVNWDMGIEDKAKVQYDEMVYRDFNRASVIMWGVGNEMSKDIQNAPHIENLAKYLRGIDSSRPVTYVCSSRDKVGENYVPFMTDSMYESLDIIALNTYGGMRDADPFDNDKHVDAYAKYGKPIIVTETGAFGLLGVRDGSEIDEINQAKFNEIQVSKILSSDYVRGLSVWVLIDGRTPIYHLNPEPGIYYYGLIQQNGEKKPAFDSLRKIYADLSSRR